ncbi:MAG: SGNH/GDSL hydrolase family protein [Verrucomicrobiota bacterium]
MNKTARALLLAIALPAIAAARDYSVFDVVGDSVSAGVNPECAGYGWVQMLFGQSACANPSQDETLTNLWPGITQYNSAVSGSKASEWADTNSYPYLGTVLNHDPNLVVVMIGGNDLIAYAGDGVFSETEQGQLRTNLMAIIGMLQSNTPPPEIVMANYYDLFDGYSTNLSLLYSNYWAASAATITADEIIRNVAESKGCFFADVYSNFMHHCYGVDLGDPSHLSPDYVRRPLSPLNFDIHPVTAGHESLYKLIYDRLLVLKDIPRFVRLEWRTNEVVLEWTSGINQSYVVQRSASLVAPEGFSAIQTNASTPTLNVHTTSVGGLDRAFYRIKVE